MKTSDAAHGRWEEILSYFNLPEINPYSHIECPLCDQKKFRIDNKTGNGDWICVCGNGDGISLVQKFTGDNFAGAAKQIDAYLGNKPVIEPPKENLELRNAINLWKGAVAVKGTMVEEYLNFRGIYVYPSGGVKYVSSYYDQALKESYPVMYAIASNSLSQPVYIHSTKVGGVKGRKLRKLQSCEGSVSIKLMPVQSTLGIAEGIETALACHQVYKLSVWSVINATFMKKFIAPPDVKHLIIYADNDKNGTGLASAFVCGNRNVLAANGPNRVTVRWTREYGDFNDALRSDFEVMEVMLYRKAK